jgi:hypothetical protein
MVYSLAVGEDGLYVGGNFTTAGPTFADYVARWDGFTWHNLGYGFDTKALALALYQGEIYAGGDFVVSGADSVAHIARWDGAAWRPLGSGMAGGAWPNVTALAVSGPELIAGGGFTLAGGNECAYVARWDGTGWSPLGAGFDAPVRNLGVAGGTLFAGGEFFTAGGAPMSHLARWDGSAWNDVEGGLDSWVDAIVEHEGKLFVGGWFQRAGIRPSYYIARWDGLPASGCAWPICEEPLDASRLSLRVTGANPSASDARLAFFLPQAAPVRLTLFDAQGRSLGDLVHGTCDAGPHAIALRSGAPGARLAAGAYFLRLQTPWGTRTARVVRVR